MGGSSAVGKGRPRRVISASHRGGIHRTSARLRCGPAGGRGCTAWPGGGYSDTMAIRLESTVERKDPALPRYVVVPEDALAQWALDGTTMVEVEVNGTSLGRRSLKRWSERGGWFFDLTEIHAERASVEVGDRVVIEIARASTELPDELRALLDDDAEARRRWESLTASRRRMLAEHVRSAKRAETRARRAAAALTDALA